MLSANEEAGFNSNMEHLNNLKALMEQILAVKRYFSFGN